MTETSSNTTSSASSTDNATAVKAETQKNERFNHVWWLPLIALLIVAYIAINHFTSQGPLATITFNSAEGLEVGKTHVKYKDVVIGNVEKIKFNNDYKDVQVVVRMNKDSEDLLRQNTRFWVVKPRVGITQVSGLNTLLSGNYITMEPDKDPNSEFKYTFKGLEIPPIISQDEPGLNVTLLSTKAASLYPGTAVYYKGMQVGTVNRVYFSDDYLWVKADVFIASPHDKLIKQTTKFWSASGISIDAGASGVEVAMESVEALIAGGISFETPISLTQDDNSEVTAGTEYILFANKKAADEQNTGRKYYFVSYFNGSVKGLSVGSSVTIQGMNVGKVKDIRLLFDENSAETKIPVLFEIYENRFNRITNGDNSDIVPPSEFDIQQLAGRLVASGLRTRLESGNLLTGSKNIALVFDKSVVAGSAVATLAEDPITGYTMLPSTAQSFDALSASVSDVINKVNQLPLDEIAGNLNQLLGNANDTINDLPLKQTINELNSLLKEGKTLSKSAKSTLKSLNGSVSDLAKTTETALAGYSADAPLYHNLNLSLEQLNDTLSSLKVVTDMLERNPNALVFGEDKPQEPQNYYWEDDKNNDKK